MTYDLSAVKYFSNYIVNGTILGKQFVDMKCLFRFSLHTLVTDLTHFCRNSARHYCGLRWSTYTLLDFNQNSTI